MTSRDVLAMRFPDIPNEYDPVPEVLGVSLITFDCTTPQAYEEIRQIDHYDMHVVDSQTPRETRRMSW
jgi:hypothetical protein